MPGKVSVIIPVFNAEKFIRAALLTITGSYKNMEIICVNDGSTDASAAVLKEFEGTIKIIQLTENKGVSFARNTGIKNSTGQFICFLDADDLYPPGKIKEQVTFLQKHREADVVWGLIQYIFLEESERKYYPEIPADTAFGVNVGAAMFRIELFDKTGLFDETLEIAEDLDLYNRIAHFGIPIFKVNKVWLYHQRHSGSLLRNKAAITLQQQLKSLHKFIQLKQTLQNESK